MAARWAKRGGRVRQHSVTLPLRRRPTMIESRVGDFGPADRSIHTVDGRCIGD